MIDSSIYNDAPEYCHYYLKLLESNILLFELEKTKLATLEVINKIKPEKENFAYAPNKWTTKQVLRHIIDCERIYTYRALRFARFDSTPLAGFDENSFNRTFDNIDQNLSDLKNEYLSVRESTIALFKSMNKEMLDFKGTANNATFTARSLGFIAVGHNIHHNNFLLSHYLHS